MIPNQEAPSKQTFTDPKTGIKYEPDSPVEKNPPKLVKRWKRQIAYTIGLGLILLMTAACSGTTIEIHADPTNPRDLAALQKLSEGFKPDPVDFNAIIPSIIQAAKNKKVEIEGDVQQVGADISSTSKDILKYMNHSTAQMLVDKGYPVEVYDEQNNFLGVWDQDNPFGDNPEYSYQIQNKEFQKQIEISASADSLRQYIFNNAINLENTRIVCAIGTDQFRELDIEKKQILAWALQYIKDNPSILVNNPNALNNYLTRLIVNGDNNNEDSMNIFLKKLTPDQATYIYEASTVPIKSFIGSDLYAQYQQSISDQTNATQVEQVPEELEQPQEVALAQSEDQTIKPTPTIEYNGSEYQPVLPLENYGKPQIEVNGMWCDLIGYNPDTGKYLYLIDGIQAEIESVSSMANAPDYVDFH